MIADQPFPKPADAKAQTAEPSAPSAPAATVEDKARPATTEPVPTPALARFHSCRWRAQPEDGAYCTHRDVLPMAGKTGFNPDSWCPDCQLFKVRRAPRKREY